MKKNVLTQVYIDELLETVKESPFALCHRLRMRPDAAQTEVMKAIWTGPSVVDLENTPSNRRVAAIMALWRVLKAENGQVLVLAPKIPLANPFFDWLGDVVFQRDPILANIALLRTRTKFQFGSEPERCMKAVANHQQGFQGYHTDALTGVVMDAGSPDFDPETLAAFEDTIEAAKSRLLLRLW